MPVIGVVINTWNRWAALRVTLERWQQVRVPCDVSLHLVIVDDGSDAPSHEWAACAVKPWVSCELIRTAHTGSASARNIGVEYLRRRTRPDIVLFCGDDVLPDEALLVEVLRGFALGAEVVSARIEWWPGCRPTSYMQWLTNGGPQFRFANKSGWSTPADIYTATVACTVATLDRVGGFDERLGGVLEDTEWSYRLLAREVRAWFAFEAVGYHNHGKTPADMRRRMHDYGACMGRLPPSVRAEVRPRRAAWYLAWACTPFRGLVSGLVDKLERGNKRWDALFALDLTIRMVMGATSAQKAPFPS